MEKAKQVLEETRKLIDEQCMEGFDIENITELANIIRSVQTIEEYLNQPEDYVAVVEPEGMIKFKRQDSDMKNLSNNNSLKSLIEKELKDATFYKELYESSGDKGIEAMARQSLYNADFFIAKLKSQSSTLLDTAAVREFQKKRDEMEQNIH